MRHRTSSVAAAAILFGVTGLPSQVPIEIGPGSRVRIHARGFAGAVVGTVTARDSSTITVRTQIASRTDSAAYRDVSITQAEITLLEVSRGQRSSAAKGALIGGVAGASVGFLAGTAYASCGNSEYCPGEVRTQATLVFGAGGAVIGALIGSFSHHDRWEPVPLTTQVGMLPVSSR